MRIYSTVMIKVQKITRSQTIITYSHLDVYVWERGVGHRNSESGLVGCI